MKTLVTGGTGFVGSHLIERLLKNQYEVYCVCQKTSNTTHLQSLPHAKNLRHVELDMSDKNSYGILDAILKDVNYIYHLAGLIKAYRAEDYDRANFYATKYLIESTARANNKKLKRFIYLSSLAAAGPSDNILGITEESPCRPMSYYGQSKLKGELALKPYQTSVPITILRPPPVYGPRDNGLLVFFKAAAMGIKLQFNGHKHVSLIYVRDLIDAIISTAEHPATAGQTYFASDTNCYPINHIIKIISRTVRPSSITFKIPDNFIEIAAELYESFCSVLRLEPSIINRQKVLELSQNYWTCRPEKIKLTSGFEASTPIEIGVRETTDWYFQNKWISK